MSEPRRAPGMDSGTGFFTGPAAENVYLNRHLEFFSIREERERERGLGERQVVYQSLFHDLFHALADMSPLNQLPSE